MKVSILISYMAKCEKYSIEPSIEGLLDYKERVQKKERVLSNRVSMQNLNQYTDFCKEFGINPDIQIAYKWDTIGQDYMREERAKREYIGKYISIKCIG